jgi:hypothetical protein
VHPLVEQLERSFMPRLKEVAAELERLCPGVQLRVWSSSVGSATAFQGHDLGVECSFPDRTGENAPDNVALSLSLCHLTTTPRVMADVVWGHPSGFSEAALRDSWRSNSEWPEATQEVLDELGGAFPGLVRAFEAAVARGVPLGETSGPTTG